MPAVDGDLLRRGRRLLAALPARRGWQAEIALERHISREVAWAEGRPDDIASGETAGLSLRVLRRGRQGCAFANTIDAAAARALYERAVAAAAFSPEDRHRALYVPNGGRARAGGVPGPDPALFRSGVKLLRDRLRAEERRVLARDRSLKKVLKMSFDESAGESAVVSDSGVAVSHRSGSVSFALEVLARRGKDVQVGWGWTESTRWRALDAARESADVADHLARSFGGKPLRSGEWPVVFAPRVGVEFLDLLSDALCADAVQRGRSFLRGRRGAAVASPRVTLMDDGRLPDGVASAPFDDEGCPTRTAVMVKDGVLRDYFYDDYTARKEGRASTGSASRDGAGGSPEPSSSNFYLAPGRGSREAMLRGTPRAFWLREVMGMHTADAVTGDFSVGASGFLLEGGRVARPVRGVTLAGNLLDLLKRVDAVADDLTWYGGTGAPTFRVSALSVGGA